MRNKDNDVWVIFVVIGVALSIFIGIILVWQSDHPSRADDVACIRAGYDGAKWEVFKSEGFCYKNVPFSQVEEK